MELCNELSALCLGTAANTVANFLNYLDGGAYEDSFVHRSAPTFVIQGGSYYVDDQGFVANIPLDPPVTNEFNQSNRRGTVAVPRLPGQVDSGTSGWFVNLADNGGPPNDLDTTDGGFTVFAVVDAEGMQVVDAIAALRRLGTQIGQVPVTDTYPCPFLPGEPCTDNPVPYFVYTVVTRVPEPGAGPAALAALGALAALRRFRS
jgi:cyclophilin family peptidyl-prolyl cis-trans isomerase